MYTSFYSYAYIIVSTDGELKPSKSMVNLPYQEAVHSGLVYYVAAALSYNEYNNSNTFTLGDKETTIGLNGQVFMNVKLSTNTAYYYFIRVYSLFYTEQVYDNVYFIFVNIIITLYLI